jgi:uncharacterized membrane protein YdjX (TVP38/TMEM64 family)
MSPDAQQDSADPAPGRKSSPALKAGLLLAGLLVILGLMFFTPLRHAVPQIQDLRNSLARFGPAAPAVFGLIVAGLVILGVPRLFLCSLGSAAFGFWPGLLWSQAGALAGYYVTFLFVRWGGRDWVCARFPKLELWAEKLAHRGILAVLAARQIPLPGLLVNLLLALLPLRHRDFLLGSAIGLLPEAIPFALIGSGLAQPSFGRGVSIVVAAVVVLVIATLALRAATRSTAKPRL